MRAHSTWTPSPPINPPTADVWGSCSAGVCSRTEVCSVSHALSASRGPPPGDCRLGSMALMASVPPVDSCVRLRWRHANDFTAVTSQQRLQSFTLIQQRMHVDERCIVYPVVASKSQCHTTQSHLCLRPARNAVEQIHEAGRVVRGGCRDRSEVSRGRGAAD